MAGDWLKVCKETPSKPEILVIATKLGIHPDIAFARCFHLWVWFDSNTKDGVTSGVTKVTLDALLHRDGLCDALVSVGWLGENEDGNLYLPNFDRHNSETAKVRALGAKRQGKHRDKSNANSNATVTLDALPEKRREEKKDIYIPPIDSGLLKDWLEVRKAKKAGKLTETAFNGLSREAGLAGITPEDAVRVCCERGWQSFKAEWYTKDKKKDDFGLGKYI